MNKLVILSGPSGSGISSCRFVFEELGFYVVENAPGELTPQLLDLFVNKSIAPRGLCIMPSISSAKETYEKAKEDKRFETTLIILNTKKDEILKRYALSRHDHPRAILFGMSLEQAIELDIKDAEELGAIANVYIDTTNLTSKELRNFIYNKIENKDTNNSTKVTFMSFGFKNGTPSGVDDIIDVRILPNPYWVAELAPLNGKDQPVIDYINSFPVTKKFLNHLVEYIDFLLEEVQKSERPSYTIGIACSGGQHRSTYVAEYLGEHFKDKYNVAVLHRDSPYLNKN